MQLKHTQESNIRLLMIAQNWNLKCKLQWWGVVKLRNGVKRGSMRHHHPELTREAHLMSDLSRGDFPWSQMIQPSIHFWFIHSRQLNSTILNELRWFLIQSKDFHWTSHNFFCSSNYYRPYFINKNKILLTLFTYPTLDITPYGPFDPSNVISKICGNYCLNELKVPYILSHVV